MRVSLGRGECAPFAPLKFSALLSWFFSVSRSQALLPPGSPGALPPPRSSGLLPSRPPQVTKVSTSSSSSSSTQVFCALAPLPARGVSSVDTSIFSPSSSSFPQSQVILYPDPDFRVLESRVSSLLISHAIRVGLPFHTPLFHHSTAGCNDDSAIG
jgi:hypothetical protein